jgi:4-amino-4-deoxy-L-arabinose transferase-like glycosyltransferase
MATVLIFYTATRVIGLVDFPIYFFCDEATHGNLAEALIDNGLRDPEGNLFPPYFLNAKVYNLGLSVWVHAATVAVFGKSIFVVRLTSVFIGLLGAAALMLALKIGFRNRLWWTAGLVMAALPGWFLHSRTAFETAMMVGFYACFLLCYLLYRMVSPRWLPAVIAFGGATFYSYSNGQGVMFISVLLLLITDVRYHWQVVRRRPLLVVTGLIVAMFVAAPYLRFRFVLHPEMVRNHFADLGSYWTQDMPRSEKIETFAKTYLKGLSPGYWFFDDTEELVRHRMLGYGHLPVWLAPFMFLGLAISIRNAHRSAAHRLVLIAILAAPFSASLVSIRITRVLAMMAPATMLAVIGLACVQGWLRRWIPPRFVASVTAAGLVFASTSMTVDALRNGATWFDDYSMGGLQWGARQLYGELEEQLEADDSVRFVVSHSWANLPNAFTAFFLDPPLQHRIGLGVIDDYLFDYRPERMAKNQVFVLTADEYERAIEHGMLDVSEPLHVIDTPDGRPGFIFARVDYSSSAREIFEAEQRERRKPVESSFLLGAIETTVSHPRFDVGTIESVFDGDLETIARTLDADPCRMVFRLAAPRPIAGVRVNIWSGYYDLRLQVESADGTQVEAELAVRAGQSFVTRELFLPEAVGGAETITLTIDKHGDNKAHIQEIAFLP